MKRPSVWAGLERMKRDKAAGQDEFTMEHITKLEELGINRVTETVNQSYDSKELPRDTTSRFLLHYSTNHEPMT